MRYATPKLDVRGGVFYENKILLVKEKADGLWTLYYKRKHEHPPALQQAYKCFIWCELLSGQPTANIETEAIGFFEEDQLPPLSPCQGSLLSRSR